MANCGAVSIAVAVLASAILLSSVTKPAGASSPTPMIKDVCASTAKEFELDSKICAETLVSEPRVVAATDLVNMSLALIEAAISNATKTRAYVQMMLKHPGLKPDYQYVLKQCDSGYVDSRSSFGSALGEAREGDYDTATYDVKIAYTDNIDLCRNALSDKKIKDVALSQGNNFMYVFGTVAFDTLDRLPSAD